MRLVSLFHVKLFSLLLFGCDLIKAVISLNNIERPNVSRETLGLSSLICICRLIRFYIIESVLSAAFLPFSDTALAWVLFF